MAVAKISIIAITIPTDATTNPIEKYLYIS